MASQGTIGGVGGICAAAVLGVVQAATAFASDLQIDPGWTAPFAGRKVSLSAFETVAPDAAAGMAWELAIGGAVVARGEAVLEAAGAGPRGARIELDIPSIRTDAVADGLFRAWRIRSDRSVAGRPVERRFPLLGANPFAARAAWLRDLRIVLFDPDGKTAGALESVGVPHERTTNLDAVPGMKPGLFLVAEGLSFREYRALSAALLRSAEGGVATLCLAPSGGEMDLPVGGPGPAGLARVALAGRDITGEWDKRLGASAWGKEGAPVLSSCILRGASGRVVAEVEAGDAGWPWIELRGEGRRATLAICGFGMISNWDRTPATRRLLLAAMEHTIGPPPGHSDPGKSSGQTEGATK
ncbi:MAG: hypothetical protein KJ579_01145 [Verrucomicrobia bacterium]|nr:hypothetical protein [Verrucomicrobiota bacterium]